MESENLYIQHLSLAAIRRFIQASKLLNALTCWQIAHISYCGLHNIGIISIYQNICFCRILFLFYIIIHFENKTTRNSVVRLEIATCRNSLWTTGRSSSEILTCIEYQNKPWRVHVYMFVLSIVPLVRSKQRNLIPHFRFKAPAEAWRESAWFPPQLFNSITSWCPALV